MRACRIEPPVTEPAGTAAGSPFRPAQMRAWFETRRDEMVDLLMCLARMESPSRDGRAQGEIRERLAGELEALGFAAEAIPGEEGCDHLRATRASPGGGRPTQLLLGHLDTVWPLGTVNHMPVEVREGRLHGPGVFDMKGGLVQMLFALRALREHGLEPPCDPVVLINADEEIGSRTSEPHIRALAAPAERVLVMEPAYGSHGHLKTARKGIGSFTLTVRGVASHAGLDPQAGVSAIHELSRQIEALFSLNDVERGITVNVGTIDGGMRPNVVAPLAVAQIEARVMTAADAEEIERAITGLMPTQDRITLAVSGGFRRPPMERTEANRRLWRRAQEAAELLGLPIGEAQVGGASDGNFTSPLAATLDGLGAVGDGAHADHEHVVVDAMPQRAALLAALLMTPPEER
jgi:glutamate carboxypeptidase